MECFLQARQCPTDKPITTSKAQNNKRNSQWIKSLLMVIRLNEPVSFDTCYHVGDKAGCL